MYKTNKYQPFENDRVLCLRANNCAVESERVSVMPRVMLYKNCNTGWFPYMWLIKCFHSFVS